MTIRKIRSGYFTASDINLSTWLLDGTAEERNTHTFTRAFILFANAPNGMFREVEGNWRTRMKPTSTQGEH